MPPTLSSRLNDTINRVLSVPPLHRARGAIGSIVYLGRPAYQRLLLEMSAHLATSLELSRVAAVLAGELPHRLHICWARLIVMDPANEQLVAVGPLSAAGPMAAVGLAAGQDGRPAMAANHPLVIAARRLGRPIVRLQPPPDLDGETLAFLDRAGAEVCLPLLTGSELAGLYLVGPRESGRPHPADEVWLLHLLSQQAAIAVQNSRLFEIERRERQRAEALLAEKEVLLQEIHHRVKNNLQVVSSLLTLQSRHIHDPAIRDMFLESRRRVQSMALIHESLRRTETVTRVDGREYVRELVQGVYEAYGLGERVRIDVHVDPVWLDVDTAIPCGLIVNELVSNALKHGFPNGRAGAVRVEVAAGAGGEITLAVADDGVGLPGGFDWQAGSSLGLHLVERLTQQIGGELAVESAPPGATFRVSFNSQKAGA